MLKIITESLPLLILGMLWLGLAGAARRFANRRRREGAWDATGPIEPTYAAPNAALRAMRIDIPDIGDQEKVRSKLSKPTEQHPK